MAMLGRVEDLTNLVNPRSRLGLGLLLLQDCVSGRFSSGARELPNLVPGETRRIAVDGDALYLLIQCYQSKQGKEGRFEAHARHTDLQYVWSGRECIEVCNLRALHPKPAYDAKGNVFFPMSNVAHSHLLLQAGEVAVLLPQDAHAPCLQAKDGESELVRKIVVKIMDAHLMGDVRATHVQSTAQNPCPGGKR